MNQTVFAEVGGRVRSDVMSKSDELLALAVRQRGGRAELRPGRGGMERADARARQNGGSQSQHDRPPSSLFAGDGSRASPKRQAIDL